MQGIVDVADGGVHPAQVGGLHPPWPAAADERLVLDATGGDDAQVDGAIEEDDAICVDELGPGHRITVAEAPTTLMCSPVRWPSGCVATPATNEVLLGEPRSGVSPRHSPPQ